LRRAFGQLFAKLAPVIDALPIRRTAMCLEIGTRSVDDGVVYPEIDLVLDRKLGGYAHGDGTPFPAQ